MKEALEQLILKFGVRGVANTFAEILQEYASDGKTLPYDTGHFPQEEPVDATDLENAAEILLAPLW